MILKLIGKDATMLIWPCSLFKNLDKRAKNGVEVLVGG
jgi:hypothetical protein